MQLHACQLLLKPKEEERCGQLSVESRKEPRRQESAELEAVLTVLSFAIVFRHLFWGSKAHFGRTFFGNKCCFQYWNLAFWAYLLYFLHSSQSFNSYLQALEIFSLSISSLSDFAGGFCRCQNSLVQTKLYSQSDMLTPQYVKYKYNLALPADVV